jgi:tRNA-dihydrouridine synthase
MRRHYTNYLKGLPHIKDFRMQLVTAKTQSEVEHVLQEITEKYTVEEVVHEATGLVNV